MVAWKVLPLLLLLGPLCRAKDAKARPPEKPQGCDAQNAEIAKLKAQIEALQQENAGLKKQTSGSDEEVPYVSTKLIVDSLKSVTGAFGEVDLDFDSVYTAANASYEVLSAASSQATEIASQGTAAAKKAMSEAAEMAQDLNKKHVEQHTKEYYDTALETYNTHVEPHVKSAMKVYGESVAPHVDMATAGIYTGVGAAQEASKTFTPKLRQLWQQGTAGLLGGAGGAALADKLAVLTEPKSITILNRTKTFRHGIMDILLAVVQAACVLYVGVGLLWKFFLKTFVWNIGVKFFGKTVCINLTAKLVKVSFRITQILLKIIYTLVFTVFSLLLTCLVLPLGVGGALGVGLFHAIEKNFSIGLSSGQRLGLGIGVGAVVWLLMCCFLRKCCRRAPSKEAKNGGKPASGKSAPAKTDTKAKGKAEAAKPTSRKK